MRFSNLWRHTGMRLQAGGYTFRACHSLTTDESDKGLSPAQPPVFLRPHWTETALRLPMRRGASRGREVLRPWSGLKENLFASVHSVAVSYLAPRNGMSDRDARAGSPYNASASLCLNWRRARRPLQRCSLPCRLSSAPHRQASQAVTLHDHRTRLARLAADFEGGRHVGRIYKIAECEKHCTD